jgi:hypothetical protein
MKLVHCAPAFTEKIKAFTPKSPGDSKRLQDLLRKLNEAIIPTDWPNSDIVGFIAPVPPIRLGLADISGAPERANLDDSGLPYSPPPVAAPSRHNRNPLEIALMRKTVFASIYLCCASREILNKDVDWLLLNLTFDPETYASRL